MYKPVCIQEHMPAVFCMTKCFFHVLHEEHERDYQACPGGHVKAYSRRAAVMRDAHDWCKIGQEECVSLLVDCLFGKNDESVSGIMSKIYQSMIACFHIFRYNTTSRIRNLF